MRQLLGKLKSDFKGELDSFRTFNRIDGHTYKGPWLSKHKHSFGNKQYVNGDVKMELGQ